MEKINLNVLYNNAHDARIAALRAKAETFVEKEAIPVLVNAAKDGEFSQVIRVPSDLIVENVIEMISERVEYKTLTRDCHRLKYFWG